MTSRHELTKAGFKKGWALVTGASAGIGAEFARQLAADGYSLVLVSRDANRLQAVGAELASKYGVEFEVIAADLTDRGQLARVEERLHSEPAVEVLVNNAGLGLNQRFATGSREQEQYLIDVLVTAVMRLSHAASGKMRERGRGDIIVVSSVASFIAGGTYSAAKAWATVFAEGLAQELRGTGVKVSALCPGFTHTEFHDRAGINKGEIPSWLWLDSRKMVAAGLRDHQRGKVVSIPSLRYKFLAWLAQTAPRKITRSVGFNLRNKSRH